MSKVEVKALLLLLLLAFGLRVAGIGFDSLWLDECYQSLIESYGYALAGFVSPHQQPFLFQFVEAASPQHVLANFRLVDPACPPLYALLLNGWMRLFGGSDIAVRMLSLVFSVCSVGALYYFVRAVFNPSVAFYASLIQAISPFDIYYGQEARMYSLVVLLTTISSLSLISLCRAERPNFAVVVGYVLSTWALLNTHYTTLFVVAAAGMWAIVCILQKRSIKLLGIMCLAWLAVLLLWLPWFHFLLDVASIRNASFYVLRKPIWWWPIYMLFGRIPINWLFFLSGKRVYLPFAAIYLTAACLLGLGFYQVRHLITKAKSLFEPAFAVLWWMLVPVLLLWIADVSEGRRVVEVSRYVIGTAPAVYILCGIGIATVTARGAFWFYVFLCHAVLAMANNTYQHLVFQREPWRQMATLVETNCPEQDFLFVCQPYDIVCLDRYLHIPRRQLSLSTSMTDAQISSALSPYKRFWLISAQEGEDIALRIPRAFRKQQETKLAHGLALRLYER